ncbi:MAG: Ig-like domain-containing protein [Candidatus Enteromonas sp.]
MKQTRGLLLLSVAAALTLAACGAPSSSSSESTGSSLEEPSSSTNDSTASEPSSSDPTSSDTGTSEDSTDSSSSINFGNRLAKAMEKDYSNLTASVYSVYDNGEFEELYYEFYVDNWFISYNPDMVQMGADPYLFYHDYEGENYLYFEADNPNDPNSKAGWLKSGQYESIQYAYPNAYFDMVTFLEEVDPSTATYQGGLYVISDPEVVAGLNSTVFSTFWNNDIQYVTILLSNDGYLSKIIGLEELEDDTDSVQIQFGDIGTTTTPLGVELPPVPSEDNVMEYWEYKGWDGPWVDTYPSSVTLTPKSQYENDVLTMEIEDVVQATYSWLPEDANQAKDWTLHSTDPSVATINFDYDDKDGNKIVKIQGVSAGDCEVYVTARGEQGKDKGAESNHIHVHVKDLADQNLEGMKYQLNFNGLLEDGTLSVRNALKNGLPVTAKANKAQLIAGYSDLFVDTQTLMLNDSQLGDGDAMASFDFDDQQVSSISLYYGLYYANDAVNKSNVKRIAIETSNDGENWTSIDVTEEVLSLISANNKKLLEKSFAPASKVRIVQETNMVGKPLRFSFDEVCFMANENCHNHGQVDHTPVESVTISASKNTVKVGQKLIMGSVVLPADATDQDLVWTSSDPSIASFKDNALTGVSAGQVTVYATATKDNVKSNELTITVEDITPVDSKLIATWKGEDGTVFEISETGMNVKIPDTDAVTLAYVDYDSENRSYHFANGANQIDVKKVFGDDNSVDIFGKVGDKTFRYGYYQSTRYVAATSIALTMTEEEVVVRKDSYKINAAFFPNNATGVGSTDLLRWTTDVEGVIEFVGKEEDDLYYEAAGNLGCSFKTLKAGTVTVTAVNGDGVTASLTITVKEPVKVASISIASAGDVNSIEVGATLQLSATVLGENGAEPYDSSIEWKSSDTSVATVNQNGLVTGKSASEQPVTITATAKDGSAVTASFTLTVTGSTGVIPADMVGTWTGNDPSGMTSEPFIFTIESDGTLTFRIDADDFETLYFSFDSVDGQTYRFKTADEAYVLDFDKSNTTINLMDGDLNDQFVDLGGGYLVCIGMNTDVSRM